MTSKESDTGVVDPPREIVESESELKEEVYKLKHQMAEMYQAWVRGHPPPSFPANYPENPTFIPPLSQAQDPITIDLSPQHAPGFTPYHHYPGTSSQTFHAPLAKTTAYPAPTSAPVFVAPPRATLHRSSSEPAFQAPDTQYYVLKPTFKVTDPYSHAPHFKPPVETEKPSQNVEQDEMFRKVKSLEQSLKNMQGIGSQVSVAYKDLCLFSDVQLPAGFKMPKFDPYDGHRDPVAHLRGFCSNMRGAGGKDELLMAYFSQSLSGAALEWYTHQDTSRWYTWDDLAQAFARHFQYNLDIVPDRLSLTKVEKRPNESFREYGFRWREQAARVYPPMEEDEMGIKSSKIMSYSAIKATTQAIQSGAGSLLGKKKKEDVAMFVSGSWRGPRGPPHQYTQTQPRPQTYTQAPYNPSQHYFPPQDPRYSVELPQYHVHHAQSYAQPPPYPQWRAPTPQNPYTPPQPYQNPTGPSFQPRPDYRKERQQRKETFTPLGESYTSLFQRLRQLDVLRPIEPKIPNPPPRNLDYSLRCAYCSDAPGHDTEKCWHLKRAIQELIDTNQIVVQSPEAPNINQNPLPAHAETHMIEIIHKDGEPKNSSKSVMMIRASKSNPTKALDSAKAMSLIVKGVSEKPSTLNMKPSVLVVKGPPVDVEANQEKQKVVVPGVPGKPIIIVEGARVTPVIIKPVTQLPMVDTKAVPWNYKQVIVTYKGKEVEEEVNGTGGLTRSGRCFTPEELRKTKPFKDGHIPVKKPVTEEEAEEFLKKMKMQDYSIIEKLRKTPAQISLLITFSDDELPMEGTEHNRALYLTVKCEDSAVSRVLVDNGSSENICPLSTLQKLKIGPVEFTMEFQVLDVAVSYNLLLGRPWIHAAKAIPSSLHQMVKFEWDRQEIVVHGDENLSAYNDIIVPFIEVEDDKGTWVYQTFETVSVEKIPEGECIPGPKLPSASVMVANEMLKNGFVPSKGLGKDMEKAKNLKRKAWSLPKPVPHISKSFVKPGVAKRPISAVPKPVVNFNEELIKRFQSLFDEVNMVEIREGSSNADVQLVGPNVKLRNWKATHLPTRKEFCSFDAGFNDMTCMRNFQPNLKSQPNSEITIQEVECDDET
ncbi:uncharacterized protein [Nicotiana tomentosiformis]|uniref:uncharacterized protein n=1 Tax=Nicotiana tomentosiformis TaxID=4098 RepID=UPI00388CA98B